MKTLSWSSLVGLKLSSLLRDLVGLRSQHRCCSHRRNRKHKPKPAHVSGLCKSKDTPWPAPPPCERTWKGTSKASVCDLSLLKHLHGIYLLLLKGQFETFKGYPHCFTFFLSPPSVFCCITSKVLMASSKAVIQLQTNCRGVNGHPASPHSKSKAWPPQISDLHWTDMCSTSSALNLLSTPMVPAPSGLHCLIREIINANLAFWLMSHEHHKKAASDLCHSFFCSLPVISITNTLAQCVYWLCTGAKSIFYAFSCNFSSSTENKIVL